MEDFGDLVRGELYYASLGEAFIDPEDPTANAATHMAELTNERLRGKKRPRMMVFRNGTHNEHEAFMVVATEMNEVGSRSIFLLQRRTENGRGRGGC